MTSKTRQAGTYLFPEDTSDAGTDYETAKQRHATVYDAVAGRVSLKFSKDSAVSGSRKTSSGHHQLADPVLAPEEVLFSRKNAPQRYAENDIYFAHESLPDGGRDALPDSDILKAVHGYASHFYEALGQLQGSTGRGKARPVDERSMDETALLAFGILLEEAARASLGKHGDLVFTEGVMDVEAEGDDGAESRAAVRRDSQAPVGFEGDEDFWRRKYAKRRKIQVDSD
ncbi:hypothetical protein N0V93_000271 [Gnomoniopsis smithogilvyi]|uniref:Uncharacterized protein n=1 Tax=Gnomoniopsis smithogilvyi TaxID=1191159 RepID=A0A9W8Z1Z0_9PEZI|nr:hypothetical protein N0V93_000271 [Gnomoniopsis smithogilvyi]